MQIIASMQKPYIALMSDILVRYYRLIGMDVVFSGDTENIHEDILGIKFNNYIDIVSTQSIQSTSIQSLNIRFSIEDLRKLSQRLSINSDYWRYYFARIHNPQLSLDKFQSVINNELNNNIGNFITRSLSLMHKYGSIIVSVSRIIMCGDQLLLDLDECASRYNELMTNSKFSDVLDICVKISTAGNKYLNYNPTSHGKIAMILYALLNFLEPFIPISIDEIRSCIRINDLTFEVLQVIQPFKKVINTLPI